MARRKLSAGLSVKGINSLIKELEKYKADITYKCQLLAERLSERGVEIARMKIAEYDAIYTGELLASINNEYGGIIQDGARWIVYTDCPWSLFVEFGTGIEGMRKPHPDPSLVGWKYDVNEHGEKGWFYFKDGKWHWTKGFPSRPFFFETAQELRNAEIIIQTAGEIFGN